MGGEMLSTIIIYDITECQNPLEAAKLENQSVWMISQQSIEIDTNRGVCEVVDHE
jgi:hypothetical protein